MKNRTPTILWGILLIALGVALLGGAMNWWDFDLFFDGWWTLFIILPCAMSMVQSGVHTGNTVGLAVGIVLLLQAQDLLPVRIYQLILPAALVIIGVTLIFRKPWHTTQQPPSQSGPQTYYAPPPSGAGTQSTPPKQGASRQARGGPSVDPFAIFSGAEACFTGYEFHGGSATAVFGGVELDLRGAIITQDVTIAATAVFGGVEVFVDDRVQVSYSSVPILGGTSCGVGARDTSLPTVFVNSVAVFGGVDIK